MPNPFKRDNKLRRNRTIFRHKLKPILAIVVGVTIVLMLQHKNIQHKYQQAEKELEFLSSLHIPSPSDHSILKSTSTTISWCDKIREERSKLHPDLHISYPCDSSATGNPDQHHYTSAVVTYLTAGVEEGKGSRTVFTGKEYINGALALGASLSQHLTSDTNKNILQLLLVKDGFTLPEIERTKLEKVGWTIGKAPNVDIERKWLPRYPRYRTVYTKISAIGLSEFECVLLLDADTLVVGDLDDLLRCNVFDNTSNDDGNSGNAKSSNYMVAGTLDYYHKRWHHFNTGSILWNTSADEMNRVYQLTKDESFMKRFESDQIFLNTVYPDRIDRKKNAVLLEEGFDLLDGNSSNHYEYWGKVANLGWRYNVQTHVEVQHQTFWKDHFAGMKIIHYTEKKGWQCPEQHDSPPSEETMSSLERCGRNVDAKVSSELCFCGLGYLWWDALKLAEEMIESNDSKGLN